MHGIHIIDYIVAFFILALVWMVFGIFVDKWIHRYWNRKLPWHLEGYNRKYKKYLKEQGNPWLKEKYNESKILM